MMDVDSPRSLRDDLDVDWPDLASNFKPAETSRNGPLIENGTIEKSDERCEYPCCTYKDSDEDMDELLKSLRNSYNELLSLDDSELEDKNKLQLKLKTLQRCFHQLIEENGLLVATVSELEREAGQRVLQMETRLHKSAKSTMEAVLHIQECEEEMRRLVMERLHVESVFEDVQHQLTALKVENGFLRDQNANLHHDIDGLLHIIQQARTTGNWEIASMTFCEVTPEQVFGPIHSVSQRTSLESLNFPVSSQGIDCLRTQCYSPSEEGSCTFSNFNDGDKHSHRTIENNTVDSRLHDELSRLKQIREETQMELLQKDKLIATLESRITALNHELTAKEAECERHLLELSEQHINESRECCWENEKIGLLYFNGSLSPGIRSEPHMNFLNVREGCCKHSSSAKEKKSVSIQTDSSIRNSKSVQAVCEESRTCLCTVSTQTDMTEVFCAGKNESKTIDVTELQETLKYYREQVQKAEDKALSKEILVNQLQSHIQTTLNEVELKDKALSNVERKLDASRQECVTLRDEIIKAKENVEALNQKILEKDSAASAMKNEAESIQKKVEEMHQKEMELQEQKRCLMVQLDIQGEELFRVNDELNLAKQHLLRYKKEVTQMNTTIETLQAAIVQSRRSLDEARKVNVNTMQSKYYQNSSGGRSSIGSLIVDI